MMMMMMTLKKFYRKKSLSKKQVDIFRKKVFKEFLLV